MIGKTMVGKTVVCVDDRPVKDAHKLFRNWIKKSQTYTIREVHKFSEQGRLGYLLNEVINDPVQCSGGLVIEPSFHARRFVELDSFTDSMSLEELEAEPTKIEVFT